MAGCERSFVGPGRKRTLRRTPEKRQGHQQRGRCAVGRGGVRTQGRRKEEGRAGWRLQLGQERPGIPDSIVRKKESL